MTSNKTPDEVKAHMKADNNTERFLALLDPTAANWTFQTFDDDGHRKDKRLVRVLHGTLAEHWATLQRLNEQGAGIFVTVNETDGKGRGRNNIVRVRAVFVDLDGAPLEPVLANGRPPHIVTETSPGRWHPYWRVVDLPLDQFASVQKSLIECFDGDPNIHDLPRVMRLPGFMHRKGKPFLSRIVSVNDAPPYKPEDFPQVDGDLRPPQQAHSTETLPQWLFDLAKGDAGKGLSDDPDDLPPPVNPAEVQAALAVIDADIDRKTWFNIGCALFDGLGDEDGFKFWNEWSIRGKKYPQLREMRSQWRSIVKEKGYGYTIGTVYYHANLADPGWRRNVERADTTNTEGTEQTAKPEDHQAPPIAAASKTTKIVLDPSDPMRSARGLIATTFIDGEQTLYRHRGAFWQWVGSHYRLADDETIKSQIWAFLEKAVRQRDKNGIFPPFKPNMALVANVADALKAATQLNKYLEPPVWLKGSDELPPPHEFLACGNGLLHLPSGELYTPTPNYFGLNASEVVFDSDAAAPVQWLVFLKQLFGEDQQAIELIQEWFGLVLSPNTSHEKILLVVGPKRSGKGTIARVLRGLLGSTSVGGPTMSNLATPFGIESLITKPLAIVSDARIGSRTDKSMIVERLLSISGEDQMTVPRKFRDDWIGQLMTRIMILTNELPSLSDGSGALAGRFIVLLLINSFFGKEDPALTDKLLVELPGILNWSIEGYRRLGERGHFVVPTSAQEAIDDIEMLGAPVKAFIRDRCNVGPGLTVKVNELWTEWTIWSEAEGRKDPGTKAWFGRNLRSAEPGITTSKHREGEERERVYNGIEVKFPF